MVRLTPALKHQKSATQRVAKGSHNDESLHALPMVESNSRRLRLQRSAHPWPTNIRVMITRWHYLHGFDAAIDVQWRGLAVVCHIKEVFRQRLVVDGIDDRNGNVFSTTTDVPGKREKKITRNIEVVHGSDSTTHHSSEVTDVGRQDALLKLPQGSKDSVLNVIGHRAKKRTNVFIFLTGWVFFFRFHKRK